MVMKPGGSGTGVGGGAEPMTGGCGVSGSMVGPGGKKLPGGKSCVGGVGVKAG
jgi:hypothetical protein